MHALAVSLDISHDSLHVHATLRSSKIDGVFNPMIPYQFVVAQDNCSNASMFVHSVGIDYIGLRSLNNGSVLKVCECADTHVVKLWINLY